MGKIGTILSIIVTIIALVSGAYLLMSNQERITELEEKSKEITIKFEVATNNAIKQCSEYPDTKCDVGLLEIYESCQEKGFEDVKVCHDGRLEKYLKDRGLR